MSKSYYVDRNHPEYGIFESDELVKALKADAKGDILQFSVEELLVALGSSSKASNKVEVSDANTSVSEKYLKYDYVVFSDGGSSPSSGGPGGYGAVVINCKTGETTELSNGYKATTNNRMEILGAATGLNAVPDGASAILISDSQYVINTMSLGWKRDANNDLWVKLDAAVEGKKSVDFLHVKGHENGKTFESKWNNRCDALSKEARKKPVLEEDAGFDK